jgi:transposase
MIRRSRRNHTPDFKSKVALAAVRGEQTLGELAQQYDVHPNQIKQWRDHLLAGANDIFGRGKKSSSDEAPIDVKTPHAKIGELTLENYFL